MVTVVSLTPHHSVVKEVVCRNCGALLSYVPADINRRVVSDYAGGKDEVNFIRCPPCGAEVTVKRY